jgi:IS605 OrfB family transposase
LFKKEHDRNVVNRIIKNSYNINYDLVDVSMLEYQVSSAFDLMKSCKERKQTKITFGSLNQWKRFNKGIISKEEFNNIKNTQPVLFTGRNSDTMGNRKIKLDINNNQIIFKKSRSEHHNLKLTTSNSRWNMLKKIQNYFEFNSTPITYRLDNKHVYITFDESILKEREHQFIENRIAGLDLNPNYIALIIKDFNNNSIIHKSIYDLNKLNETYFKNKKNHEAVEIAKKISNLCKHYKVECVGLEKLTMSSKDHGKGRKLNRLLNSWSLLKFSQNLIKRLNILGIQNQEVVCAYSSTVGCLDHPEETDSIAAALEISRRTYVFLNRYVKKRKEFSDRDVMFPDVDRKLIKERWNSILSEYNPKNIGYKGIHEYLRDNKKLNELRFLFKDYDFSQWSCFSLKSYKSLVGTHQYVLLQIT